MAETIFVGHKPDTYKAYKVIGGWSIMFLDSKGGSRPADGNKVYTHRQNAYARVKQMNHPVVHALKRSPVDACEAFWNGYTYSVRRDEDKNFRTIYTLSIQREALPPHWQCDFKTIEDVEEHLREEGRLYLDWRKVEEGD